MSDALVEPFEDLDTGATIAAGAEPRLVGTACSTCGQRMLGQRFACSSCASTAVAQTGLATTGSVYSWTNVHVFPDSSRPVLVAYVDLDDGVRVFGRLADAATAVIGAPVALATAGEEWWFERVPDPSMPGSEAAT